MRSAIALALAAALAAAAVQWVVALGIQAAKLPPLRELTQIHTDDSVAIVFERSLFRSQQEFIAFGDPLRPATREPRAGPPATDFPLEPGFGPQPTTQEIDLEAKNDVIRSSMRELLRRTRERLARVDYLTVSTFGFPFHSLQFSHQTIRSFPQAQPSSQQEWTSRAAHWRGLIIPLKVRWLPMAGNMAAFALTALAARALVLATRRALRRRRGLCPTCAYQTSLPTCPECGHKEEQPHASAPVPVTATI